MTFDYVGTAQEKSLAISCYLTKVAITSGEWCRIGAYLPLALADGHIRPWSSPPCLANAATIREVVRVLLPVVTLALVNVLCISGISNPQLIVAHKYDKLLISKNHV